MNFIQGYVLDALSELLNHFRVSPYSSKYWFLIGSSVIGTIRDWESKDIDVFYFYYGNNKKSKNKHRNAGIKAFYSDLAYTLEIDIVQSLTIDSFTNGKMSLTEYIFKENREKFTEQLGRMRAIKPEAYFLIRLPLKDRHPLELMYEKLFNKNLPDIIKKTAKKFNLSLGEFA